MKFDEMDRRMRVFETDCNQFALPGIYMVARLDGRSFTHLTKEVHRFEAPFDERFRDLMVATTSHLMQCGFRVIYGYTQSDEISLLFHRDEDSFNRRLQKLVSILAGEASARFSLLLGSLASFDCRISQLPLEEYVCDYFRWRAEDAHRNALNGHCYWMLRNQGQMAAEAMSLLYKMPVAQKNELLFRGGINYNDIPAWQKRGSGLFWEAQARSGLNPITGEQTATQRRKLKVEFELPMKEPYADFIVGLINGSQAGE